MESDPKAAKVSLDAAISSMWNTAKAMNKKFKETSEGGLALEIPVNISEC
jgi:L-serine dehydratase